MNRLLNPLLSASRGKFAKRVVMLASGTAGAQLVTMAVSPFLTRIYGPEAFGVLGLFNSVVSVVATSIALAYPIAIVLPKEERDAVGLAALSIYISTSLTLLLTIILMVIYQPILTILGLEPLAPFVWLIPVAVVVSAWMQIAYNWLLRNNYFSSIARTNLIQSVAVGITQVVMGLLYPVGGALITITVLGRLVHAFSLGFSGSRHSIVRSLCQWRLTSLNRAQVWALARDYRDFAQFRAPQLLLNAASLGIPVMLLSAYYGPAVAGLYTLCTSVLTIPSRLIGTSIGDVFYPRIAQARASGDNLTPYIVKATVVLAVVGAVPYGVIFLGGPFLFSLVFGDPWRIAGEFAQIVAIWQFASLISRPAVRSLPVLSAQRFHLNFTLLWTAIRVAGIVLGYMLFRSAEASVLLFSVAAFISYIYLIAHVITLSYRHDRKLQSQGELGLD